MTKRWKLKTNSSNILLVLITLILVKAEWIKAGDDDSCTNSTGTNGVQTQIYVGNDEIADYFFSSSVDDNFFVLEGMTKCLDSFHLVTCVKMWLLNRMNDVVGLVQKPNVVEKDLRLLNGLLILRQKKETMSSGRDEENEELSLDEEIAAKVKRIFDGRTLLVNLLPRVKIEIHPSVGNHSDDFICFQYKIRRESDLENTETVNTNEGRKKRKGGMSMMMMVPQLIMLGLMPFTLASLKAMVMNAVMINTMALNGAIFMTIRNLVFGPRQGDKVKYVNYGYSKDRQTQSQKPVLIIHSPAAFVKQPPVFKKQKHQNYFPQNDIGDYESGYNIVEEDVNRANKGRETIRRRNEPGRRFHKLNGSDLADNENQNANYWINPYRRTRKADVKTDRSSFHRNAKTGSGSDQEVDPNYDPSGDPSGARTKGRGLTRERREMSKPTMERS